MITDQRKDIGFKPQSSIDYYHLLRRLHRIIRNNLKISYYNLMQCVCYYTYIRIISPTCNETPHTHSIYSTNIHNSHTCISIHVTVFQSHNLIKRKLRERSHAVCLHYVECVYVCCNFGSSLRNSILSASDVQKFVQ